MKKTLLLTLFLCGLMALSVQKNVYGQRYMENLNRGAVAVRTSTSQVLVSWRILGTEYTAGATYNLYRGSSLIASGLSVSNYSDNISTSSTYSVAAVINGTEQTKSDAIGVWDTFYKTISISPPSGGKTPDGVSYTYTANDCSVGDLDGDGEYEIILKWDPTNSKDNSQSGYTGNVYLDAIKLNGTRLWRVDLGVNIRAGAHYTQFLVYDFNGDGKAEVVFKGAPGTKDNGGTVLGGTPVTDYRNSSGYILSGPEYLCVVSGASGNIVNYQSYNPPRGTVSDWGDSYGNRVDRFLAGVAYLNGSTPSIVMCRGYYTRSVLVAYDYVGNTLTQKWIFDTDNGYSSYAGQGNHSLSVADVDNDGYDEIIYGSMAVDHNGKGLWSSGLGHGDALHVADIDPSRSGLEVWGIHEGTSTPGSALLDAKTGAVLWSTAKADVGRGVAADLSSSYAGMECWGGTSGLRSATNASVGTAPSYANFTIWWDGDVSRELHDGDKLDKWVNGSMNRLVTLYNYESATYNNSTKRNVCLQADMLGDWREEILMRSSDNTKLILFTTNTSTTQRMYTLMHDPVYRLGIAWQNVGYNQPPHLGFFFGNGMSTPPNPKIQLVGGTNTCTATAIIPYVQVNGGSWSQSTSIGVAVGDEVIIGPQPNTGGTWSWTGPNSFTSTSRQITISNIQTYQAGSYVATYTNSCGAVSQLTFYISVSDGSAGSVTIEENTTGFCSVDGYVESNNDGYTGTGFANTDNASGTGIDWKVNFLSAGTKTFTFRYAATSDRPANLIVNGTTVYSGLNFPTTGSWATWSYVSVSVSTDADIMDVRLEATSSSGLANIDNITITDASAASCSSETVSYTLTTSISGQGSVSPSSGTYNAGTSVTLTATPSSGWQFDNWSNGSTNNPLTIVMDSDKSLTANFSQNTDVTTTTIEIQENTTGFCGVDGTIDNNNVGYTGDGFANTTNASGNGIDWYFQGYGGSYTFTWRYANGGTDTRPGNLIVNGSTVASNIAFNSTGAWTTWSTNSVTVTLSYGIYDVRLEATSATGLANIDYLSISGPDAAIVACGTTENLKNTDEFDGSGNVISGLNGSDIVIYPNPSKVGKFYMDFSKIENSELNVHIYNSVGQEVYSKNLNNEIILEVTGLTQGFYIISVVANNKEFKKTLIVE